MSEPSPATKLNRRAVLAAGAGALALPALGSNGALAQTAPDFGPAAAIRERASTFLAALSPEQRARAMFAYGDRTWRGWNFFGVGGYIKPGLRLEEMTPAQKDLAWDLAAAVLSGRGLGKARDVMDLQQVLSERGSGGRSRERFSFALFDEPAASGTWALRIEGHHLSLSYTVRDDRLVGVTPSSFSVNPNRVGPAGFRAGLVTLREEDDLARRLAADLAGGVRERAFFRDRPYRNILASAGRESSLTTPEGTPLADLTAGQRELAARVIAAYTTDHLRQPFADAVARSLGAGDPGAVRFAVAGSPEPATPLYYRFQGTGFVIEYASVDAEAQHLHTVFHLV
jgi:Protein of unknown function (DUF3500)